MKQRAFTLLEVMIVVLVIGILISIAIPQMMTARRNAALKGCQSNMKLFDTVKSQYAIDQQVSSNDPVSLNDLLPYLRRVPECPMGGVYDFGTVGSNTHCSLPEHPHPDE